jgi:hypothetical protein
MWKVTGRVSSPRHHISLASVVCCLFALCANSRVYRSAESRQIGSVTVRNDGLSLGPRDVLASTNKFGKTLTRNNSLHLKKRDLYTPLIRENSSIDTGLLCRDCP